MKITRMIQIAKEENGNYERTLARMKSEAEKEIPDSFLTKLSLSITIIRKAVRIPFIKGRTVSYIVTGLTPLGESLYMDELRHVENKMMLKHADIKQGVTKKSGAKTDHYILSCEDGVIKRI